MAEFEVDGWSLWKKLDTNQSLIDSKEFYSEKLLIGKNAHSNSIGDLTLGNA